MVDFEWELVDALNRFFEVEGVRAIAYRLKQSRYTPQVVDLLVDSPHPEYYMAIECKSVDARKAKTLYFTQHFSVAGGAHQIDRADQFLLKSGRRGLLAVELRRGPGRPKAAHFVSWEEVLQRFRSKEAGLPVERIETFPVVKRRGGCYLLSEENLAEI